jgi:hypothetical protein
MKYLFFLALLALTTCRIHHRQATPAVSPSPAFQGEAQGNYWWPVDSFNTYSVCADRCRAAGFVVAEVRLKGTATSPGKVLDQSCCHEAGDVEIHLIDQNHREVEGYYDGLDGKPSWSDLDPKSRVCPEFQRVGKKELITKIGYAWFNQRTISCPWIG